MVFDTSLLNTQHYKIWIKGKWSNQGKEVAPSLHLSVVAIEKGAFGSSSTTINLLTYIYIYIYIYISKHVCVCMYTYTYILIHICVCVFSFMQYTNMQRIIYVYTQPYILNFGMQTSLENKNTEFKPAVHSLKIVLVLNPPYGRRI